MGTGGNGIDVSKKPSLYNSREDGCWLCGNPNVEEHHILPSSRRPISDREGLTIYLCRNHHQGPMGVHQDKQLDKWLRADAQRRWEQREGLEGKEAHDAFRKVFYVSYL